MKRQSLLLSMPALEHAVHLISPEFIQLNGCIFLKREYKNWTLPSSMSRTERECTVNHIHILDEVEHSAGLSEKSGKFWNSRHADFKLGWKLAKIIGDCWFQKLSKTFPNKGFRVYCTRLDNPIIRFHVHRGNEGDYLDKEDRDTIIYK